MIALCRYVVVLKISGQKGLLEINCYRDLTGAQRSGLFSDWTRGQLQVFWLWGLGPFNLTPVRPPSAAQSNPLSFFLLLDKKTTANTVPLSHSSCHLSSDLFPKSGCFVTFPEFHSPGVGGNSVLPHSPLLSIIGKFLICIPVSPTFNAPKPAFIAITSLKFMK